jgi:protein phosphatase
MGSTCVAIHLTPGMVHIAHVGDSRCYRIRDGEIEQMTRDHSLINDALDMKPDLTKEELARLPKNIITRALGMKDVVKVDVKSEPVLPGDTFLLCSDGLTGMVPVHQILEVVGLTAEPQEACELLIAEANDAGGTDNISAVIVRVEEELATPELDADVEAHADLVEDEEEVIAADADVEELAADAAHFTEEDPATRPFQVEPSSGERPRAPDPWADGPTSLPWGAAEPLDGEHADGEDEPATRPFQITDDESVPELSAEPVVDDLVAAEMAAALAEGGEIDLDLRGPWPGKLPTLRCASCRHELFPGNRFCVECGSPIQSVTV